MPTRAEPDIVVTSSEIKVWNPRSGTWHALPMKYVHAAFASEDIAFFTFSPEDSRMLQEDLVDEGESPRDEIAERVLELEISDAEQAFSRAGFTRTWKNEAWGRYEHGTQGDVRDPAAAIQWMTPRKSYTHLMIAAAVGFILAFFGRPYLEMLSPVWLGDSSYEVTFVVIFLVIWLALDAVFKKNINRKTARVERFSEKE